LGIFLSEVVEGWIKIETGSLMFGPKLIVAFELCFSEGVEIIVFEEEVPWIDVLECVDREGEEEETENGE
jgi:hypothetical protein